MKRAKLLFTLFIFTFITFEAAVGQESRSPDSTRQVAWQIFKDNYGSDWTIRWNERTGLPRTIAHGQSKSYKGTPEAAARAFLADQRNLFGMKSDLSDLHLVKSTENRDGLHRVSFQQMHENIPVEEAEYKVQVFKDGKIGMVNGFYYQNIDVSTSPAISSQQAINNAKSDLELQSPTGESNSAELTILPKDDGTFALAWKTIIHSEYPFTDWLYFIDAHSGSILKKYNRLMDVTGSGKVYTTHPGLNSSTPVENFYRLDGNGRLQGTYAYVVNDVASEAYSASHEFEYSTSSTHFDEANLYYHVDDFRHNFIENLGSLGFTQITAHAHSNNYPGPNNAWFSPSSEDIYFGDGTGSGFNSFAREDKIIYHEYGHAVIYDIQSGIQSTSDEEGAISEGTPDYFAGSYTGRSIIGDYAAPNYKRDMSNPNIDSYSEYQNDSPGAHAGGEFFSSILWNIRNNTGITTAQTDYLVFEALNGITGSPNFLDFRDAMMTADDAAYSGAHNDLIQDTFADKGVGYHATPQISAPTNLAASSGGGGFGQVILNWDDNSEQDLDYYKVYRKHMGVDPGFQHIASPSGSNYNDYEVSTTMGTSQEFRYYVTAVNTSSLESNQSNTVYVDGESTVQKTNPGTPEALPEIFSLQQNYPNPFNPSTQITYALPEAAEVSIKVYNIMGQQVATLVNNNMNAGLHEITFDAGALSSGMYIARMEAVGESGTRFNRELKMQLIK